MSVIPELLIIGVPLICALQIGCDIAIMSVPVMYLLAMVRLGSKSRDMLRGGLGRIKTVL